METITPFPFGYKQYDFLQKKLCSLIFCSLDFSRNIKFLILYQPYVFLSTQTQYYYIAENFDACPYTSKVGSNYYIINF